MNITIDRLKQSIRNKNYVWFEDKPNIIGIRSNIDVPDIFNDLLCVTYKDKGVEVLKIYPCTTDPGVFYQKKLLNSKGCAIIQPQQAIDAYAIGFHQGRDGKKINPKTNQPFAIHRALVLVGDIRIKRDKDLDGIAGNSGVEESGKNTGCNIHGTLSNTISKTIGPWSAGCQVLPNWTHKEELINICERYRSFCKNRFTYTLLLERELL